MRWVYIAIGMLVLGASAYMSIEAVGGLSSEAAPGLVAVALILAVGSAAIGHALAGRHTAIAVAILLGMLAGEVAAIVSTAQRVTASRSATRGPILEAEARRNEALQRLARAEQAVSRAEGDIAEKAALSGCRANCRQLLQDAKDAAVNERAAARVAVQTVAPPKASATPLSDATGIQQWLLDLIEALSVSLAANLPASALIALGVRMGTRRDRTEITVDQSEHTNAAAPSPVTVEAVVMLPEPQTLKRDAAEEAGRFGVARLHPKPNGQMTQRDLRLAYLDWCEEIGVEPLPTSEIAPALGKLFRKAGIKVRDGMALNIALKANLTENRATG